MLYGLVERCEWSETGRSWKLPGEFCRKAAANAPNPAAAAVRGVCSKCSSEPATAAAMGPATRPGLMGEGSRVGTRRPVRGMGSVDLRVRIRESGMRPAENEVRLTELGRRHR